MLLWARRLAAVFIFILAVVAALVAGLVTPYFLATQTPNIPLLSISSVASFALLTCMGTKLALSCWGTAKRRAAATLSGVLTIIFLGCLYVGDSVLFCASQAGPVTAPESEILQNPDRQLMVPERCRLRSVKSPKDFISFPNSFIPRRKLPFPILQVIMSYWRTMDVSDEQSSEWHM